MVQQIHSHVFIQENFLRICSQTTCAIHSRFTYYSQKSGNNADRRLFLVRPLATCPLSFHMNPFAPFAFHLCSQNTPVSRMSMLLNSAIPSAQSSPPVLLVHPSRTSSSSLSCCPSLLFAVLSLLSRRILE